MVLGELIWLAGAGEGAEPRSGGGCVSTLSAKRREGQLQNKLVTMLTSPGVVVIGMSRIILPYPFPLNCDMKNLPEAACLRQREVDFTGTSVRQHYKYGVDAKDGKGIHVLSKLQELEISSRTA
jgi:hypothetical protein